MRAELLERLASVDRLGDHAHVRLSRDKVSNAPTDEPVIVDRQDADYIGVIAHNCGLLGVAVTAFDSQERLAFSAVS